jgi:hypothetical protein
MSFYKNSEGDVAKLMRAGSLYVVMLRFSNKFFDTETAAGDFLKARGFYKGGANE